MRCLMKDRRFRVNGPLFLYWILFIASHVTGQLPAAYYGYIRVAGSSANNIIYLPFPNKAAVEAYSAKINKLFSPR